MVHKNLLLTLFVSIIVQAQKDVCNVLVFAGEGDCSPYQVGAAKGLIESLSANDTRYDVVAGVSSGSINAAALSQYALGDESKWVADMTTFWESFTTDDFYKSRFLDGIVALLDEPGYYNTEAMESTLQKLIPAKPQRNVVIGTVDLETGFYHSWNNSNTQDWSTIAQASMAIPGIFPYVEYKGSKLADGSKFKSVDMIGAIRECQSIGYDTEHMKIDVLLAAKQNLKVEVTGEYNTLQVLKRYMSLSSFTDCIEQINYAKDGFFGKGIQVRIVYPSQDLPNNGDGLYTFTSKDASDMIAQGEADAKAVLKKEQEEMNRLEYD